MTSNVCTDASYDNVSNSSTEMQNQLKDGVCQTVCSWRCFTCRLLDDDRSDDALAVLRSAEAEFAHLMSPGARARHTYLQGKAIAIKWHVQGSMWDLETAKGFTTALTHFECARAMHPRNSSEVPLTAGRTCVSCLSAWL